jgi:hypothetical protein|tara:strand:+ start:247 stop:1038 length:792 start_codon:yes stop_codon:yes gene_type:complete
MGRHKKLLKLKNMKKANLMVERHLLKEAPGMPIWKVCGPNEAGGFASVQSMGGLPVGMTVSFFISASTSWYDTSPMTIGGTVNTNVFQPAGNLVNMAGINHLTAADVMSDLDTVEAGGCTGISINSPDMSADPFWQGVQMSGFQTFCAEFTGYGDMQSSGAMPLVYPPGTQIINSWVSPEPPSGGGNCECCDYIPNTGGPGTGNGEAGNLEYIEKDKTKDVSVGDEDEDENLGMSTKDKPKGMKQMKEQWLNEEIKKMKKLIN